jgi:iron-chelate-transporting ATPase
VTGLTLLGNHLRLGYADQVVVDDCSLRLAHGRITALVGPNGSGKSTLLRALARLHPIGSGSVHLSDDGGDRNARALSPREFARRLTMLTQHRPTPAGMTVAEVVALGRHPHRARLFGGDPDGPAAVMRALRLTRLADFADRSVDSLSGGQAQRVWLAACLAQDTPILLLDEPTNHLDLRHQVDLLELLRDLADHHGVTVGVVLHDLNQAAALADEVVLLCDGGIVAQGAPIDVFTDDRLSAAYGVAVDVTTDARGDLRVSALATLTRRAPLAATA